MMLKKWIAGLLSACIAAGNVTAGASSLAAVNYFAASAEESVDAANENTDDSTLEDVLEATTNLYLTRQVILEHA